MCCVCDAAVLAGVIWPAHEHQSSITSSSLTAVYFIDSRVFFSFCAACAFIPFLSPSTSSSASTALFLSDERENTEVVLAKENLRDKHLV